MKLRALLLAASLSLTFVAAPAQANSVVVGLAYDTGGPGDQSFNDATAAGVKSAQKKSNFALETVVTDGSVKNRELRLRSLIAKNCDPIIAIGSGYAAIINNLSREYPDTQFVLINDATVEGLNVTSIIFNELQGAYLAGVAAAFASKSGKVAMIAGPDQSSLYTDGFVAGVKASKKKVSSIVSYATSNLGATTKSAISSGADVIFVSVAGSDTDIFNEIVKANTSKNRKKGSPEVSLISVEPDQYLSVTPSSKRYLIATIEKRVDIAVADVIAAGIARTQILDILDEENGIYGRNYGIAEEGIELVLRSKSLSSQIDAINQASVGAEKLHA